MFNITIIGTINRDTIIFPDGRKKQSFGGILFNILTFSYLGKNRVKFFPVCNLGYDVFSEVMAYIKDLKNVDLSGIKKVNKKNNHAFLYYDKTKERKEILRHSVPKLSFKQIKPFLKSDVILVNFISGFDLSLATLKKIRRSSVALIFMDLHSLTLGIEKDGRRFYRSPAGWEEWVSQTDILQLNFIEFLTLAKRKLETLEEIKSFGDKILNLGVQFVLVTGGEKSGYFIKREKNETKLQCIKVPEMEKVKDITGCGDVFSAAFLLSYLKGEKPQNAFETANFIASQKCRYSGIDNLKKLQDIKDKIF